MERGPFLQVPRGAAGGSAVGVRWRGAPFEGGDRGAVWYRRVSPPAGGEAGSPKAVLAHAGPEGGSSSSSSAARSWATFFSEGWRQTLFEGLVRGLGERGLGVESAVVDGNEAFFVVAKSNRTSGEGGVERPSEGEAPTASQWHIVFEEWERRDAGGDHLVMIQGLAPGEEYEYTIGGASEAWEALPEGRPTFTFRAWPAPSPKPASGGGLRCAAGGNCWRVPPADGGTWARAWVLGDCGRGGGTPRRVRDAMLRHAASDAAPEDGRAPEAPAWDVTLALGDNAYSDGGEWEHTHHFFEVYDEINARAPVMPTMGNHEGHSSDLMEGTGPYYDAFELPTKGESGGVPSGHPSYYSFDFGDIHFVSIDSENHVPYNDDKLFDWLERDLEAAQDASWRVAYFHHPPYSKGSHDSDDEWGLYKMRERLVPLLEEKRVDLVFTGHSHCYERSDLLGGLYEGSSKADEHTVARPEKVRNNENGEGGDAEEANPEEEGGGGGGAPGRGRTVGRAVSGPRWPPLQVTWRHGGEQGARGR